MLKFSPKQRLLLVPLLAIPIAIFFAARSAASWRPRLVAVQPSGHSFIKTPNKLLLSPDESQLVVWADNKQEGSQWNLTTGEKRVLQGYKGDFSADGHWLVTRSELDKVYVYDSTKLRWQQDFAAMPQEDFVRVSFAGTNQLVVSTSRLVRVFDLSTGKEVEQHRAPANEMQTFWSDYGTPPLAPDGRRLKWTLHNYKQFAITDARTERKLWSHSLAHADSGANFCYPRFEDDGKMFVTIENDTIIDRDSRTGKVVSSHKNPLPSPLKSWAFTKNRDSVYLMDARGRIFRQRIR